jgi:di/tripeptidase
MDNLERLRTFVVDLDALLKQRDQYHRDLRAIHMETEVISRSALPGMEQQKEMALQQGKAASLQADEAVRVTHRLLWELTGSDDVTEARKLLVSLKAAFNRVSEAQANVADTTMLLATTKDEDDPDYLANLRTVAATAIKELAAVSAYLESTVPSSYSPEGNKITIPELVI